LCLDARRAAVKMVKRRGKSRQYGVKGDIEDGEVKH
jgi:hypothetical protein